ncbi:hypothetical protein FRB94_008124 [Tulasnella sp. JGI-2019a]|nr:hypothetical protein FRB94_008124 [Tulasnella sp. JGI-2019a]KAG9017324.1 hypothetical protein FRB93_007438 [Tulasnella sp. JGI-2019a]KAG9034059.1 hypothetical protein FRB95_013828 [Tulasnella sp. JGI-2019a]
MWLFDGQLAANTGDFEQTSSLTQSAFEGGAKSIVVSPGLSLLVEELEGDGSRQSLSTKRALQQPQLSLALTPVWVWSTILHLTDAVPRSSLSLACGICGVLS